MCTVHIAGRIPGSELEAMDERHCAVMARGRLEEVYLVYVILGEELGELRPSLCKLLSPTSHLGACDHYHEHNNFGEL
jgi:hypothetical protein